MWMFLAEQITNNCEGMWRSTRLEQMVGEGAVIGRLNQSSWDCRERKVNESVI